MTDRFSLRFASGERQGESVPIPAPRATLGRRPGNTLQVQDGSISGKHAEFVTEGGSVTLRDLASTNGTRVSGKKIIEQQLAHGDRLLFGSVEALFVDGEAPSFDDELGELADSPTPVATPRPPAAEPEQAVGRISADKLARSGKRSKAGLLVGVVLLLAGGAAAFFLRGGEGGGGRKVEAPLQVAGNLLAGGDFEGDELAANWTIEALGAADFSQSGSARATGEDGLRSSLEAGERARLVSEPVSVMPGKLLRLEASLRARAGAALRVGIEFLPGAAGEEGGPGGLTAWSEVILEVTQHQRIAVEAPVPPGVRRARIVAEAFTSAGEGGSADVDDLSLVAQGSGATPAAKVGEFSLWLLGTPTQSAALFKISKPLFGDLHGVGADLTRTYALEQAASSDAQSSGRIALTAVGASGLSLRVEPEALRQGLASLGQGGFLEHSSTFEREAATSLLLAAGKDLVGLHFEAPVKLTGRPEGGGLRITISGARATSVALQLDFTADRVEAGNLAYAARKAEKEGRLGDTMADWKALLETYPFEAALVTEARQARARLEQAGLEELEAVIQSFERAKFFRLLDLFRLCQENARKVAATYAGSEVEARAEALIGEIEVEQAGLRTDLNSDEIARLRSILRVLEATESPKLAGEVQSYLTEEYGVEN